MALDAIYSTGTVSVAQGGTTVTGVGTNFVTALVRKGDLFANATLSAMAMVTDDPTSPTELKIEAWPGTGLSAGSPFKIIRLPDAVRMIEAYAKLAGVLVPNLTAFGDLQGAADKLPYFTGPGAVDLADLTPGARAVLALTGAAGKIPVFTGNDSAAARDIVGTVSQSGGTPTGAIIERGSNANGEYVRFADGTQMCRRAVTWNPSNGTSQIWYFPAEFADTDRVSCSISFQATGNAQSRGAYLETTIGTTSSNTEWSVMTSSTVNAEYIISFFAIGRWS